MASIWYHESSVRKGCPYWRDERYIPGVQGGFGNPGNVLTIKEHCPSSASNLQRFSKCEQTEDPIRRWCLSWYGKYIVPGKAKLNDLGCLLVYQNVLSWVSHYRAYKDQLDQDGPGHRAPITLCCRGSVPAFIWGYIVEDVLLPAHTLSFCRFYICSRWPNHLTGCSRCFLSLALF